MALTEKYVSSLAGGSGNGLSEGTAYTFDQMLAEMRSLSGTGGVGKRYNIKADGTYNRPAGDEDVESCLGTRSDPIAWRGYKTTIGDGYLGRDSAGALITTNMPNIFYANGMFISQRYGSLESIQITGSRGDWIFKMNAWSVMVGCLVSNTGTSGDVGTALLNEYAICFECDFTLLGTTGTTRSVVRMTNPAVKVDSCRIISNSPGINGVYAEEQSYLYGCLIKGAAGSTQPGVVLNGSGRHMEIRNCTITNWQHGIKYEGTTERPSILAGNMITDCSGYAFYYGSAECPICIGPNRVRDNASGNSNIATNWSDTGRIIPLITTDTGGPETDYVNAAGDDFNLIAASPAKNNNIPKFSELGCYGIAVGTGPALVSVFHPLLPQIIRPAPSD